MPGEDAVLRGNRTTVFIMVLDGDSLGVRVVP